MPRQRTLLLTWVNCGPDWDNDTAKSPQTGEPLARTSRDLGVMRRLSNLHSDKNLQCQLLPALTYIKKCEKGPFFGQQKGP